MIIHIMVLLLLFDLLVHKIVDVLFTISWTDISIFALFMNEIEQNIAQIHWPLF